MTDQPPDGFLAIEPLSTRWNAPAFDAGRIRAELGRLWQRWGTAYGEGEPYTAGGRDQVYMRPSTVNVIAIAGDESEAARVADMLGALPDYSPSRSIVLAREGGGSDEGPFGVRIEVNERRLLKNSSPTRIEVITLTAPTGNDDALASVASTLPVPDLPDVVFLPNEPVAGNELVVNLLENSDGLLVDTVSSRETGKSLAFLAQVNTDRMRLGIGDLVWTRLRTWRDLIAQFFDQPAALASLDQLDDVRIVYAPRTENGRSGLTAGLLMAGWLASRLGWKAPGDLIPSSEGHRLTLRAGERGRSREVLLHLVPGTSPSSCSSLERVRLSARGAQPCEFRVERADEAAITTFSSTVHAPDMTRLVHAGCPDDKVILAAKLRRLRIDPVYCDALQFAASLWPEGYDE